jgi:hypothetical protein
MATIVTTAVVAETARRARANSEGSAGNTTIVARAKRHNAVPDGIVAPVPLLAADQARDGGRGRRAAPSPVCGTEAASAKNT